MKSIWRYVVAINLSLIPSLTVLAASVDEPNKQSGYLCVPNATGDAWDCAEDTGQRPVRARINKLPKSAADTVSPALPAGGAASAPQSDEQNALEATSGIDPVTGLSLNPADWYVPTSPRPQESEFLPVADLAASRYVRTADQGRAAAQLCQGDYVERQFPHPTTARDENFPVVAEADSLSSEIDVTAQLSGNVSIEQGNRLIVAPVADLSYVDRVVNFPAGVRLDQPGMLMQGQVAEVELNSKAADLSGVQFVLTDANIRGEANTLVQDAGGDLTLTDNRFTRCEPGNNGWSLATDELQIAEDEVFGTAKHAVLRLKSIPVFYTPYLKFPVSDERVSGFLFPNLGYSDEDGTDVSIPYYFNLAPNYDATLIPRYMSKRGAGAELELRHMSGWQNTVLRGALLPDDDIYNGTISRDDFDSAGGAAVLGDFNPADRWLGAMNHDGRLGPFRTLIDYTSVSDRDYFRDLGSDLSVSSRRELERKGEIQYGRGGLFMRLWAQRFQRLDAATIEDYRRLPELELTYARNLVGPLSFNLGAKWSDFHRDNDGLTGINALNGQRTHLEPRLQLGLSRPYGFFSMSGGLRYTAYELNQPSVLGPLDDDSPDRNIGLATVDSGLFFERDLNWFGTELIQTLEPRVYYLWQEFDEQSQLPRFDASRLTFGYSQLFRDNRFSGLDRIGDADQVSAGVTTRFLSRASGREYFRFSLGEIFYFDDRRVTLSGTTTPAELQSSSAIAAEVSAALYGSWRVTGNMVWDPHDNQVDEGGVGIQYKRDNRHIFNVGFRKRLDQDIEQTDVSLYWPITRRLAILGRWNYDLESGRTIEGFGGLEYGDCCLQIRLMARRFLDSPTARNFAEVAADEGVFLQIVFKGLAGFGTKVESVLERGIRGYRAPQQQDYFSN